MEILDLRGVDPTQDKPTRLNVWRPRRRDRAQGETFHEALPAMAATGFVLPEISESTVRVGLATLATLASITVLTLTLTQLLTSDGTRAKSEGGGQVQTAQTSTPTAEPSASAPAETGAGPTTSTPPTGTGGGTQPTTSSDGSGAGTSTGPTVDTGGAVPDPTVCIPNPLTPLCVTIK